MEPNSWEDCGFPNIHFRTAYLPWVGLVKALNERVRTAPYLQLPVPGYFTPIPEKMFLTCYRFDNEGLIWAVSQFNNQRFINPDKIQPPDPSLNDCLWTLPDLLLAAAGGIEEDIVTSNDPADILMPEFPVKWAIQRYNAINLLRYVYTGHSSVFPYFTYEDINDTYNFKAPEP